MAKQRLNNQQSPIVKRKNNATTISEEGSKIQTGWVAITPLAGNSSATASITFPDSYDTTPIVVASFAGDTTSVTATLGQGLNAKQAYGGAIQISTSGFTAYVATRDSSNYNGSTTVYLTWIVIGK